MLMVCYLLEAQQRYTFESGQLGPEWHYVGQPDISKYCFVDGKLRLKGSVFELFEGKQATFVGLEQASDTFTVDTKVTLFDAENGDEAGLCVFHSRQGYVQCSLNNFQGSRRLKVRLQLLSHHLLLADRTVGTLTDVWLRVTSDAHKLKFFYSTDGEKYLWLEDVEQRLLSADLTGATEPPLVGMFAFMGSTKYQSGYTFGDFEFFNIAY